MDSLNEEINVVLEQSLDEIFGIGKPRSKASRWKYYKRSGGRPAAPSPEEDEEVIDDPDEMPTEDIPAGERTTTEDLTKLPKETLNEDKLAPIIIDFNQLRKEELNESFLAMFGGWVEHILGAMFGNTSIPVSVRGNRREVESFARTIGSEKNYLESARRHGLDHPMTYKNKAKLDGAVKGFEKDTGLKWPFK
jgi:hypothetical protein